MANNSVSHPNFTILEAITGLPGRAVLSMTPCAFFLYINLVMLVTLRSKATFRETPRYILFANMLFADSLHLLFCMLLYILAAVGLSVNGYLCLIALLAGDIVARISPVNLAAMSLEQYIAICFPLRHAQIATCRRTGSAIAIVWALGSLNTIADLAAFVTSRSSFASFRGYCSGSMFLHLEVYVLLNNVFTVFYFLPVGIIIIFTYIGIVVAARSVSTNSVSAAKAHKTVLLHLIQLGLSLSSILFDTTTTIAYVHLDIISALNVQYVMFLGLIILPRCLSPLIYGLRDQMFKRVFKYYFTFSFRTTIKPIHMLW